MSDIELLCVLNNNTLILNLLEIKFKENKLLFSYLTPKKRKPVDFYTARVNCWIKLHSYIRPQYNY